MRVEEVGAPGYGVPPEAADRSAGYEGRPRRGPGELEQVLSASFQRLKATPGMFWLILLTILGGAVVVEVFGFLFGGVALGLATRVPLLLPFLVLGGAVLFVLATLFGVGADRAALAVARKEPVPFGLILAGFQRAVPIVAATVLMVLPFLLAGLAIAALIGGLGMATPSGAGLIARLIGVGAVILMGLLLLVFAFYLTIRWSLAIFAILEDDLGPVEALGSSWDLTSGRVMTVFVIHLISFLVSVVAALIQPLLVVVLAWYLVTLAELYVRARGAPNAPRRVPDWDRQTWSDRLVIRED